MTQIRQGRQTPTTAVVMPYKETCGGEAVELYTKTGNHLLEWQELLLFDFLAQTDEKLWAHQKYGYSIPRRNGKSESVLARCLYGLAKGERILYTAHRTSTTHAIWTRLERMCAKANIEVISSFRAFGKEHIYTATEGIIEFRTRTSSGGLGEGYDLLIIDEAQEYTEAQETALKYVVSDSPNPQTIMLGTPPTMVSVGTVFTKYRETVLAGDGYDSGWSEWSVMYESDPYDIELWYETNPSLGTILTERKIRSEITTDHLDFCIQRLGYWVMYNQKSAITRAEWEALTEKKPNLEGNIYAGVKYGRDGRNVSLGVAVKDKAGNIFLEVIDCRSVSEGNEWIVSWLHKLNPAVVAVDGVGAQDVLEADMKEARLKAPVKPKVKEVVYAYADFEQALHKGSIRHGGQPSLIEAAANSDKRAIGSNGGFGYRSMKEEIDISLLDCVILAHWQCRTSKEKRKQRASY